MCNACGLYYKLHNVSHTDHELWWRLLQITHNVNDHTHLITSPHDLKSGFVCQNYFFLSSWFFWGKLLCAKAEGHCQLVCGFHYWALRCLLLVPSGPLALQISLIVSIILVSHGHSVINARDQREWVFEVREVKSENKKLSLFFKKCKVKKMLSIFFEKCKVKRKCFHSFREVKSEK